MGREQNDASSPIADIRPVWCRCDLWYQTLFLVPVEIVMGGPHYSDCWREYKHRLATVDGHMENHAETSYSGRIHRYEHPQELDARYSTFHNTGRDQHNYYYTFVGDNHFHSRETSDVHDSGTDKYVGSDDCQAAAIVSTTTFVTTNAAVAAPYLGILNCNSATLAVKIPSVRYTFFSD